jgi:hypothetical protein
MIGPGKSACPKQSALAFSTALIDRLPKLCVIVPAKRGYLKLLHITTVFLSQSWIRRPAPRVFAFQIQLANASDAWTQSTTAELLAEIGS